MIDCNAFPFGFFFQGHDTTTSGITFCLYNIARNPDVQRKCFEEIVEIFGKDLKAPTTLTQLNQLSYLELVIKESLRLFPSVPFVGRMATDDINLSKVFFVILFDFGLIEK